MAKIGMLMLDHGRWQGKQIVPAAWIKQMTTPLPAAADYSYYCWIQHVVEKDQPEFGAMGSKGQFITVLPRRNTVIVMTSMLPVEGGLRDAKNVQLSRQMVNGYIVPALDNAQHARPSAQRRAALDQEMEVSARTQGIPGTSMDPTDRPKL